MQKTQMELTLPREAHPWREIRRRRGLPKARWWFEQMRQVVNATADWQPAIPARSGRLDEAMASATAEPAPDHRNWSSLGASALKGVA